MLSDLNITNNNDISYTSFYIKSLCMINYIQPCDTKGNKKQYIKV